MTTLSSKSSARFKSSKELLGDVGIEAAADIIAAGSDVALILDEDGVIQDSAFPGAEMARDAFDDWVGQPWVDIVTVESRPKVEALLTAARSKTDIVWRHVNHPTGREADTPVMYTAMQVGEEGPIIAVGRDLREVAALQQRLVDAQLTIERDFEKLRQAETRYRLLFQLSGEAVVIVDAATKKVVEANPAALEMLQASARKLIGSRILDAFESVDIAQLEQALQSARATGRSGDVASRLKGGFGVSVSVSTFRQGHAVSFLMRLQPLERAETRRGLGTLDAVSRIIEKSPEGFVVTDPDGRILSANAAFVNSAQLASIEQAIGEPLERWVGRPGVDVVVLFDKLREHGSVRFFSTVVRGEHGGDVEVELSAVAALNADPPCVGFMIRSVGSRVATAQSGGVNLPKSAERLSELVGRVPLKDIVRDTTDVIERLCIEAALEITGDNRALAAEMLGLSRQSLYVKLRRYGLGDLNSGAEA